MITFGINMAPKPGKQHATTLPKRWWNALAWLGIGALAWFVLSVLVAVFNALGGLMQ